MRLAVALLFGAFLVLWLAPAVLVAGVRHRMEPRAALAAWLVLVVSTFVTLVAAVVTSLVPGHGPARQVVRALQHCWLAVSGGEMPPVEALVGLTGATLLAVTSARVLHAGTCRIRTQRDVHRRHVDVLRGIARVEPGRFPLLWLEHPQPVAYSIAGGSSPRSVIIASRGLVDRLPARDVAAVLDHERAHLRGRHHLLVGLAEALATAMPWLPLMRTSPALIRTLVELAADRAAVRVHGPAPVRAALLAMTGGETPRGSLAMGGDDVSVRLRWLEAESAPGRMRAAAAATLAGLSAAVVPAAIGGGLLAAAGLVTCITTALG
ncbi:MAG: M48 family metalloprotease [Pseudonocardiaceae bacterium]|nr:M48 family metalloprotease [Pseudonocardiaceae bacterium]